MAIVNCRECDSEISSFATNCPKCGCPMSKKPENKKSHIGTILGIIFIVVCLLFSVGILIAINEDDKIMGALNSEIERLKNLPEMPIEVTYRPAYMGDGLVAQFTNRSNEYLSVIIELHNNSINYEKSYRLDLSPQETKELGHMEGWAFASGDSISLLSSQYRTKKVVMP